MNYEMGGTILSKIVKEKYLGVTLNANMKVSEQCRFDASKGNQVLGMMRRNITYKEKNSLVLLYKATSWITRLRPGYLQHNYVYLCISFLYNLFSFFPCRSWHSSNF